MTTNNFEKMLGELIDLELNEISEAAVERAKWILMDTLFVAWYGNKAKELQNYIQSVKSNDNPDEKVFPIIGETSKTSIYHQMVIHGTSIVSNEMDEGNQYAKGHPAAHTFPPALAAALENNASGEEFLRAFIIGYETCARFAEVAAMDDDMHPHGTWGMIGGAVATGILQKKLKEDIIEAVYIAASLPIATSWQSAVTGKTIRNLYTGLSCWQAYNASQLQSYGFRSSMHIVNHLWGNIMSDQKDLNQTKFTAKPPFMIEQNYFKLFPACRFSHPSVDALNNVLLDNSIKIDEIDKVEVSTYGLAARLDNANPESLLASKFSIPFLLSTILNGYSLFETYKESVFNNNKIRELANRVIIREDETLNNLLPDKRAAKVTIKLKNGVEKSSFVDTASGEYNLPFTKEIMKNKMRKVADGTLSGTAIEKIIQNTLEIESQNNLFKWVSLITDLQEDSEEGI